jgi:16S rRNA (cytidine1402-2'-O)-methyltransferase
MLKIIATPIGNPGDITLRAIESLKSAEIVIGEERREVSTMLKRLGIENKDIHLLNEHTTDEEVADLLKLCRQKTVALVSDAGTPGFCDPGARLVSACRAENLQITTLPGASALMCLISMAGAQMKNFIFAGFPPAERDQRADALSYWALEKRAVVLMDTPYRLAKLLSELAGFAPERKALLGMDFTLETETVLEGTLTHLAAQVQERKAEFMILLYPDATLVQQTQRPPRAVKPQETQRSAPRPSNKKRFTPGRRRRP